MAFAFVVAAPFQRVSIEPLLDSYDRADYVAVAQQLRAVKDAGALDRLDEDLHDRAERWIESVPPSEQRRRAFIAGAVAAELTHVLAERHTFGDGRADNRSVAPRALAKINRYVWDRLRTSPDSLDRLWTLTCLSTWQDWGVAIGGFDQFWAGWAMLLGERGLLGDRAGPDILGNGGFLAEATRHFPSDGRLALASLEGMESVETRCPAPYCHDEMTPSTVKDLRQRARGAPPSLPQFPHSLLRRIHEMANQNLAAFDRLQPMAARFAALAVAYPEVAAEARVHIGYLAIRSARPDAALAPLGAAAISNDPHVRYLAEHLSGRALEALGRRPEAIAAYRRALEVVPNAPVTVTLLAAQLFLSDDAEDRLEAHAVLRTSMLAHPRPADPWKLYWYGDARLWPTYMDDLRAELRR